MKKGFKVLVIDNDTGEEIVNEPRAVGFLGVVGEVIENGIGNDIFTARAVCRTKCGKFEAVQMIGCLQNLLAQILKEHPEFDALATAIAMAGKNASEKETE